MLGQHQQRHHRLLLWALFLEVIMFQAVTYVNKFKNAVAAFVAMLFMVNTAVIPVSFAQVAFLPTPGSMVDFSPKFNQASLKGIVFHPQNPFKFDFILDEGDSHLDQEEAMAQSQKIAAYFLASLTTPEKEIWVNLSPFEKGRIVPPSFGNTLMGQNLLAQDYMLKQIMASALYPEKDLGKEFWQKVYKQAEEKFGTTNIAFNTFNKVWIVPDKAVVYENAKMNAVFVAESSLKVMLEKDYLAENIHKVGFNTVPAEDSVASAMSSAVVRELVIPALEKEVNEGKNFAPLRQVYQALILAKWYKDNLKNNVIAKGYVDQNKIEGVNSQDTQMVSEIYGQYLKAYRKGVFNFIKEDFDEASQSVVPRKYFSGGFMGAVQVTKSEDGAMIANGFTKGLIASVLLTVASAATPALAQQAQPVVLGAIGTSQTVTPAVPLNAYQKQKLLNTIKEASDGKGNPVAAIEALRQIVDDSAAEYAAGILRLNSGGTWDKNNLLSNSDGPGLRSGISSGFSAPLALTNLGVVQGFGKIISTMRERGNVGNDTLRLEAAFYLMRVADQISRGSTAWQKLSNKGTYESLTRFDPDNTVMAARFLTQAVFIKLGLASRILAGGTAIAGLEQVEKGLESSDWLVRYSALAVLDAIAQNDPDNRYQAMIMRYLQQPVGKSTERMVEIEMAAVIAARHGMPALSAVMERMEEFSNTRPVDDIVALRNWHEHMQGLMQTSIQLSKGNKSVLIANLEAMAGRLTASGSTETVNSFYLGLLFSAVQSGELTSTDFVNQLNGLRQRYGGSKVSLRDVPIGPKGGDVGAYLVGLKNGENIEENAHRIVVEGGPIYFPELLTIFQETNDVAIARGILGEVSTMLSVGVNASRTNPWTLAMGAKADHPNLTMRQVVTEYALSTGSGDAVARAFEDTNNRAGVMNVLRGMIASGATSKDHVPAIIRFVFSQKNPILDPTETGQTQAFYQLITLSAQVIANSGVGETEFSALIAGNTPTDETGILTRRLLQRAVAVIREGGDPRTALEQIGEQDWVYAEKIFLSYLRGSPGVTSAKVASAIEAANQTYKKPSDPSSGEAITEKLMTRYVVSPMYRNSADMMKMADVFTALSNKDLGFELLSGLLNSHVPQVDETVLKMFAQANTNQKSRAATQMVQTYLFYFGNRDIGNPDSVRMEAVMAQRLRALGGTALGDAIKNRIPIVTDSERRALVGLGLTGSTAVQGQRLASTTPSGETRVTRTTRTTPAKYSYAQALTAVLNPNVGGDKLVEILNDMLRMNFPSTALDDLNSALNSSKYNNTDYRVALQKVIAAAQNQLGKGIVDSTKYQTTIDSYFKEFEQAPDAETQVATLRLFLSAPPEIAGDLFWKGIALVEKKYPQFAGDVQQRQDFFDVLKTMRDIIKNLKNMDAVKYQAIVGHLQNNLEKISRAKRFDHGYGMLYLFVQSLDAKLVAGIDLGIKSAPDTTHFLNAPDQPTLTIVKGGKEIPAAHAVLASKLNRIVSITSTVAGQDPLQDAEDLFDPANPTRQILAMQHLGGKTLLFLGKMPHQSADVQTFMLYQANQFVVPGNHPEMMMEETKNFSDQDWILYMGQLTKRGPQAWDKVRQYLQDENLFAHHPAAVNELVFGIGARGTADMVEPLLHFYLDRELIGYNTGIGRLDTSYIGKSVGNAVVAMGKRDGNVRARIEAFIKNLPKYTQNWVNVGPILKQLMDKISDKAMINTPDPTGGIDLEKIHLQSQGTGGVATAFDDPAQLTILMSSNGLIPTIENIKPLTAPVINQLLGSI